MQATWNDPTATWADLAVAWDGTRLGVSQPNTYTGPQFVRRPAPPLRLKIRKRYRWFAFAYVELVQPVRNTRTWQATSRTRHAFRVERRAQRTVTIHQRRSLVASAWYGDQRSLHHTLRLATAQHEHATQTVRVVEHTTPAQRQARDDEDVLLLVAASL